MATPLGTISSTTDIEEFIQDVVGTNAGSTGFLQAGAGISLTYSDAANQLTITNTGGGAGGGFISAIGDTNTVDLTVTSGTLIGVVPTTANMQVASLGIGVAPSPNLFYVRSGVSDLATITSAAVPALKLQQDGSSAGIQLGTNVSKLYPSTSPFSGEVRVEYAGTGSAPTTTAAGISNTTAGGDAALNFYEASSWKAGVTYKGTQNSLWLYLNTGSDNVAIVNNGAWDGTPGSSGLHRLSVLAQSFTNAVNGPRGGNATGTAAADWVTYDSACTGGASFYVMADMVATYASKGSIQHYWVNGSHEEPLTAVSIAASPSGVTQSGTLVKVTTTSAHGLVTGDTVFIGSQVVGTQANGFWTVTVIDTTNFTLDTSVWSGSAGGGGTVLELCYSEQTGFQDFRTHNTYGGLTEGMEINLTLNKIGRIQGVIVGFTEDTPSGYPSYANTRVLGTGGGAAATPGSYYNSASIAFHASANTSSTSTIKESGTAFIASYSSIFSGWKRYMVIRDETKTDQFVIAKHATVTNANGIGVAAMAFGTTVNQTTNTVGLPCAFILSPGTNQPTTQEYGIQFGLLNQVYVHRTGNCVLGITGTHALIALNNDAYAGSLRLIPAYSGAFTVTRHNYIDVLNPTVVGSTVTDACVFRFDAAIGTHKALASNGSVASVFTANAGPTGAATAIQGWMKVNINGTKRHIPFW